MSQTVVLNLSLDEEKFNELVSSAVAKAMAKHCRATEEESEKYLTKKQVGERYSIALSTVNAYTSSGRLKAYRLGRRVLYKQNELDSLLN